MQRLTQEGWYRGPVLEHGVAKTKKGYPQFVAQIMGAEIWEEGDQGEEGQWVDFFEYDAGLTGYFVLYGADHKELFHAKDIMAATGWNGKSFSELSEMDIPKVQFQVEENTYQDNTTLQITCIRPYDAKPGVSIRKLEGDDLKSLDAEFSQELKALAGVTASVASKKSAPPKTTSGPVEPPTEPKPPKRRGRGPGKKKADPPPKAVTTQPCTLVEAWEAYLEQAEQTDLNEDQITEIWTEVIEVVCPGKEEENDITEEEWGVIRAKLLAHEKICKF